MAVVENVGISSLMGSSNWAGTFTGVENDVVASDRHQTINTAAESLGGVKSTTNGTSFNIKFGTHQEEKIVTSNQNSLRLPSVEFSNTKPPSSQDLNDIISQSPKQNNIMGSFTDEEEVNHQFNKGDEIHHVKLSNGIGEEGVVMVDNEGFNKDMRELEEMLSKLNPMAAEFVPPSLVNYWPPVVAPAGHFGYSANSSPIHDNAIGYPARKKWYEQKKSGYNSAKRKLNGRTSLAQQEEVIRRTVYVSDIDHQVTEEQLANLFLHCGQVVDCRVCGDPNSVLRFAFIEFTDEEGAFSALSLSGTMLGYYPVMVQPSKTAIAPVNPTFLPQSEDEREMCTRTIYCTNIDKQVTAADVKLFFESICGQVQRLRLLGDYQHSTRISFVEFVRAESAIAALNCSGAILGSLPLRISPSKTPVRPRLPRSSMH